MILENKLIQNRHELEIIAALVNHIEWNYITIKFTD